MLQRAYAHLPDRWTVIDVAGAALLGGGVWARWGASWACILWGSMLLALSVLRAVAMEQARRRARVVPE